jgi:hypothetical protein
VTRDDLERACACREPVVFGRRSFLVTAVADCRSCRCSAAPACIAVVDLVTATAPGGVAVTNCHIRAADGAHTASPDSATSLDPQRIEGNNHP